MTLDLMCLDAADREALVDWLVSETWPFHVNVQLNEEQVHLWWDEGRFIGPEVLSFWIQDGDDERIGIARLEDLDDETPLIDLRLRHAHRGRGLGQEALRLLASHAFESLPQVRRLEGHTRVDNLAMRHAFRRCGFVMEAHYRRTWPTSGGVHVDGLAYALLREDWVTGVTTPVPWDHE